MQTKEEPQNENQPLSDQLATIARQQAECHQSTKTEESIRANNCVATPIEIWQIIYTAMVLSCKSRQDIALVLKSFSLVSKLHYTITSAQVFTTYLRAFHDKYHLMGEVCAYFVTPSTSVYTTADMRFLMEHPLFTPNIHLSFDPGTYSEPAHEYGKFKSFSLNHPDCENSRIITCSEVHIVHLALKDKHYNWLRYFLKKDASLVRATSYITNEASSYKIQTRIFGRLPGEIVDLELENSLRAKVLTLSAAIIDIDDSNYFRILKEFNPNAAEQPIPCRIQVGETTTLTPFEYALFHNKQKTVKYLLDTAPESCNPKPSVLNLAVGVGSLTPTIFRAIFRKFAKNYTYEGTLFNTLCYVGNIELVEFFLARGQRPDQADVLNAIESKSHKVFQLVFDAHMKNGTETSKINTVRAALSLCVTKIYGMDPYRTYILDRIDFDIWQLLEPQPEQLDIVYLRLFWTLLRSERHEKTLLGTDRDGNNLAHYLIPYLALRETTEDDIVIIKATADFISKNYSYYLQANKFGMLPIHSLLGNHTHSAIYKFSLALKLSTLQSGFKMFLIPDSTGKTAIHSLLEMLNACETTDIKNQVLTLNDNNIKARNLFQAIADSEGSNPLHFLARYVKNSSIFMLFKQQCFFDVPIDVSAVDGKNILHIAFANKNYDLINNLGALKHLLIKKDIHRKVPYEYITDWNDHLLRQCLDAIVDKLPLGLYCQKLLEQQKALELFLNESIVSAQNDIAKKEKLQHIQTKMTAFNYTLDQLFDLIEEVREICKQPDEGLVGLVNFNWLKNPEDHQQFEKVFDGNNNPKPNF